VTDELFPFEEPLPFGLPGALALRQEVRLMETRRSTGSKKENFIAGLAKVCEWREPFTIRDAAKKSTVMASCKSNTRGGRDGFGNCLNDGNPEAAVGLEFTVTVRVAVVLALATRVTWPLENLQEMPGGGFPQPRETEPWKLEEAIEIAKSCEVPTLIMAELGETEPEYVPACTVRETEAVAAL
jgi:hypothetical protein